MRTALALVSLSMMIAACQGEEGQAVRLDERRPLEATQETLEEAIDLAPEALGEAWNDAQAIDAAQDECSGEHASESGRPEAIRSATSQLLLIRGHTHLDGGEWHSHDDGEWHSHDDGEVPLVETHFIIARYFTTVEEAQEAHTLRDRACLLLQTLHGERGEEDVVWQTEPDETVGSSTLDMARITAAGAQEGEVSSTYVAQICSRIANVVVCGYHTSIAYTRSGSGAAGDPGTIKRMHENTMSRAVSVLSAD